MTASYCTCDNKKGIDALHRGEEEEDEGEEKKEGEEAEEREREAGRRRGRRGSAEQGRTVTTLVELRTRMWRCAYVLYGSSGGLCKPRKGRKEESLRKAQ